MNGPQRFELIRFILGVLYTVIWSSTFYFQMYLMVKLRSSEGYSLDFQIFNLIGFSFLLGTYLSSFLEKQSFERGMDLAFAANALGTSIIMFAMSFIYPRKRNKASTSLGFIVLTILVMSELFLLLNTYVVKGPFSDSWIFVGLTKSLMSTLKYLYQIFLNHVRI